MPTPPKQELPKENVPERPPEKVGEEKAVPEVSLGGRVEKEKKREEEKSKALRGSVQQRTEIEAPKAAEGALEKSEEKSAEPSAAPETATQPRLTPPETNVSAPRMFLERVRQAGIDIKNDFVQGDWKTKAGYIAGGVIGFLVARWAWHQLFGDPKEHKEGWVKKGFKWILGIGVSVLGLLGVKALRDKWKEAIEPAGGLGDKDRDNPYIPNAIEDPAEGIIAGTARGMEALKQSFGPVGEQLLTLPHMGPVLKKQFLSQQPYESKTAFTSAVALALVQDGVPTAVLAGRAAMLVGKTLYKDLYGVLEEAIMLTMDPSWEHFEGLVSVYVEGMVVYAGGLGALQLVMARNPIPVVKQSLLWPYHVVSKTGKITFGLLNGQTWTAVRDVTLSKTSYYWRYQMATKPRITNLLLRRTILEQYLAEEELFEGYSDLLKRMESNKIVSSQTRGLVKYRNEILLEHLKNKLLTLEKEGNLPAEIRAFIDAEYAPYGKTSIADMDLDNIRDIVAHTKPAPTKGPVPPPTPGSTKSTPPPPGSTAKPSEAPETGPTKASDAVDTIVRESEWRSAIRKAGGTITAENIDAFLKTAQREGAIALDTDTLALIEQSEKAKRIIAGAVKASESTGDLSEVIRALNAAKAARNLRIGLNGVGLAGDVFGAYMAYADFAANGERIETAKQTKNAELAALYENANIVYAAEGTQSVAGIAIGGVAVVKAWVSGQSILTALGASGGLIMLPVAVAAVSGKFVHGKAERVTETWLRNAKDWERALPPGELLEELKELAPGERGYWQGWGKGTVAEQIVRTRFNSLQEFAEWEMDGEKQIENANAYAREQITKAYIARTTSLPQLPGESETDYQRRFDRSILDQMEYLARITDGSFALMPSNVYQNARTYAALMARSRELQKYHQREYITWTNADGVEESVNIADVERLPWKDNGDGMLSKQFVLSRYTQKLMRDEALQINCMLRLRSNLDDATKRAIVMKLLLNKCLDSLLKLDGRIAAVDFRGVLSGERRAETVARLTAASMIREEVSKQADDLLAKASTPEGIGASDVLQATERMASVIEKKDLLAFQREGVKRGFAQDDDALLRVNSNLLTPDGIMRELLTSP